MRQVVVKSNMMQQDCENATLLSLHTGTRGQAVKDEVWSKRFMLRFMLRCRCASRVFEEPPNVPAQGMHSRRSPLKPWGASVSVAFHLRGSSSCLSPLRPPAEDLVRHSASPGACGGSCPLCFCFSHCRGCPSHSRNVSSCIQGAS
jgi:hypothetical protein